MFDLVSVFLTHDRELKIQIRFFIEAERLLVVASNTLIRVGRTSARLTREQTEFIVFCPTSARGYQGRNSYTSIPVAGPKPDCLVDYISYLRRDKKLEK